MGFVVSSVD